MHSSARRALLQTSIYYVYECAAVTAAAAAALLHHYAQRSCRWHCMRACAREPVMPGRCRCCCWCCCWCRVHKFKWTSWENHSHHVSGVCVCVFVTHDMLYTRSTQARVYLSNIRMVVLMFLFWDSESVFVCVCVSCEMTEMRSESGRVVNEQFRQLKREWHSFSVATARHCLVVIVLLLLHNMQWGKHRQRDIRAS